MRRLDLPTDTASEVYRRCAKAVKGIAKKTRMLSIESDIVVATDEYTNAVRNADLHKIPQADNVADKVCAKEMVSLYKTHMSRKNGVARDVYDRLMAAPCHKKCPLCGHRIVSTLDHHLPESLYPAFAVFPNNLVPACKDCNKEKGKATPTDANHQTVHPYFDDFESERWLYAAVCKTQPAAVNFSVSPPEHWGRTKTRRANYHFTLLKLSDLYKAHAAEELVNIRYSLTNLYKKTGSDGVRLHLLGEAKSRAAAHINSWQTATYEALASDEWFCNGGFAKA